MTATQSVGYFGKLPSAADFVSDPAGAADALAWSKWLRDSTERTHERFREGGAARLRALQPTCFRFAGDAGGLLGAFVASRDTSGRVFPFSLFTPNAPLADDRAGDDLLRAGDLAAQASAKARESTDAAPTAAFSALEGTPRAAERLSGCTIAGLDDAMVASRYGSRTILAVSNLLELSHRPTLPTFGLRLPLPSEAGARTSAIAFWSGAIDRCFQTPLAATSAFWWATNEGGAFDLYFARPSAIAFLHLVDPTLDSEHLYWVDEAPAPRNPQVPEEARTHLAELEETDFSLADALDRLPSRGDAR